MSGLITLPHDSFWGCGLCFTHIPIWGICVMKLSIESCSENHAPAHEVQEDALAKDGIVDEQVGGDDVVGGPKY